MKLLKCHIEAYGKIANTDFAFDKSISSFYFGNGHGKTTLASFIKAMFFGLKGVRANSKDFDDRLKYYPFSGGRFGGNLTFAKDGVTYKIERFFDQKSETRDTLAVYRNGELSDELSADIGRKVFGLDSESFERAITMSSADTYYGTTQGISARLGSFAMGDGADYERAFNILDSKKRKLKAAKGKNDLITKEAEKIRELEAKIENAARLDAELSLLYQKRESTQAKVAELNELKDKLNSARLAKEKLSTYQRYTREIEEKEQSTAAIFAKYPNGFPSADTVISSGEELRELERLRAVLNSPYINERKSARLGELQSLFKCRDTDADIKVLEADAEAFASAEEELKKNAVTVRHSERFSERIPDSGEIEKQKENAKKYTELTGKTRDMMAAGGHSRSRMLIFSAIPLLAAAVIFFILKFYIAGALLAVGGALLLTAFALFGKKEAATLIKESDGYETELKAFLLRYGYNIAEPGSAAYTFALFMKEYEEFTEDTERSVTLFARAEELKANAEAASERISKSLTSYGIVGHEPIDGILCLKHLYSDYKELMLEMSEAKRSTEGLSEKISTHTECLYSLLGEFSVCKNGTVTALRDIYKASPQSLSDSLRDIEIDRGLYLASLCELDLMKSAANEYRDSSSLENAEPDSSVLDAEERVSALPSMIENLARIDKDIAGIEANLEYLPKYKAELELANEKLLELKREYMLLDKALTALGTAERNLSERYIAPVRERFLGFAKRIEESIGESYTMDRQFNIRFDAFGESRDERHMSAGQHTVVALALRLALIDAMFESDPPFIILDDPFASLDENYLSKVQKLLSEVSKTHQIIYFTCHNSRRI